MAEKISRYCDFEVTRKRQKQECGNPVPNDEPTAFTVGTTRYLMDLCEEHQETLGDTLAPFIAIAHDAQQRRGTQVRKAIQGKEGAFTVKDVREWLKAQGRDVPPTGRLPNSVIEEYQAAQGR